MQSIFISLIFAIFVYFNVFSFSTAQDLYDVDDYFKRDARFYEVKKGSSSPVDKSIREPRKTPPAKSKSQDSPYADEHFNFDTLAGIGLGKRSPGRLSKFAQARNSLQKSLLFRPISMEGMKEKRFLNHADLDRATQYRVAKQAGNGKKKTTFPFLWLN